jgi:hypothetical protein
VLWLERGSLFLGSCNNPQMFKKIKFGRSLSEHVEGSKYQQTKSRYRKEAWCMGLGDLAGLVLLRWIHFGCNSGGSSNTRDVDEVPGPKFTPGFSCACCPCRPGLGGPLESNHQSDSVLRHCRGLRMSVALSSRLGTLCGIVIWRPWNIAR